MPSSPARERVDKQTKRLLDLRAALEAAHSKGNTARAVQLMGQIRRLEDSSVRR
jgi:uncharacterized protein HemY